MLAINQKFCFIRLFLATYKQIISNSAACLQTLMNEFVLIAFLSKNTGTNIEFFLELYCKV